MESKCDNCGRFVETARQVVHTWPDIPNLTERIEPGGTAPSGECPDCGALVYPVRKTGDADTFRVEWSIDLEADGFTDAARRAAGIQRGGDSIANVFRVISGASGAEKTVDLDHPDRD